MTPREAGARPLPEVVLALQRTVGNAAVVRLLSRGQPADSGAGSAAGPPDEAEVVPRETGSPLPSPVRSEMEGRFGADFSDVRLHTGPDARHLAADFGARAYTTGSHVVVGEAGMDDRTLAHELTHVLQQRRGQVAGREVRPGVRLSEPADRDEREAEAVAGRVAAGHRVDRLAARAGGPADGPSRIQRVLTAQITSRNAETIDALFVADRPGSAYSGTMGDHTTAFAVHVDAVRRRVCGRTAEQAAQGIRELFDAARDLPGYGLAKRVDTDDRARGADASAKGESEGESEAGPSRRRAPAEPSRPSLFKAEEALENELGDFPRDGTPALTHVQDMVVAFLTFRELIPLTAVNIKAAGRIASGGKTRGESGHRRVLKACQERDERTDADEEEDVETKHAVTSAVFGMLDARSVVLASSETDPRELARLAPGLPVEFSPQARQRLIVRQHVSSIAEAYPSAIDRLGGADAAVETLLGMLAKPLRKHLKGQRHHYREQLTSIEKKFSRARDGVDTVQKGRGLKGRQQKTSVEQQDRLKRWKLFYGLYKAAGGKEELSPPSLEKKAPESERPRRTRKQRQIAHDPAPPARPGPRTKPVASEKKPVAVGRHVAELSHDEEAEEPEATHADAPSADQGTPPTPRSPGTPPEESRARQRGPFAVQIVWREGIARELRTGSRPPSVGLGGAKGAHTTAWAVLVDAVRAVVQGQALGVAKRAMVEFSADDHARLTDFKHESPAHEEAEKEAQRAFEDAWDTVNGTLERDDPADAIRLQNLITAYLVHVNLQPGAVVPATTANPRNEGRYRNLLVDFQPGSRLKSSMRELQNAVLGLLDLTAVEDKDREALAERHRNLIEIAYPAAMEASGLAAEDPEALVRLWQTYEDLRNKHKVDEGDDGEYEM